MAFVAIHELGGFEEVGFFAFGDGEEAVLVGVDELARLDAAAEGFNFAIPFHGAGVGVTDAEAGGEGLEAGVGHLVDVADAAVGDGADAAEGSVGVAVTSPQKEPTKLGLSRSWTTAILGPGTLAR